ncbi:MAG: hypothetical protein WBL44_09960, partial [Nitrososphaeraceae archaeon]
MSLLLYTQLKIRQSDFGFSTSNRPGICQWMDRITTIVLYVLVVILASIVFQIAFFSSYHIYSLISVMLISYG